MSEAARQIFIRNEHGRVWGPLSVPTVELLIDSGQLEGRLQVSEDGLDYRDPGQFPHLRAAFPQDLWGETAPGETLPIAAPPVPVTMGEGGGLMPGAPPVIMPSGPARPQGAPPPQPPPAAAPAQRNNAPPRAAAAPGHPAAARGNPGPPPTLQPRPGAAPAAPPPTLQPAAGPGARPAGPGPARTMPPPTLQPAAGAPPRPASGPPAVAPPKLHPAPPTLHAPGSPPTVATAPPAAPAAAPSAARPAGAATATDDELPASGELSSISPIRLYYLAAAGDRTGLLTFSLPDRTIEVHFRKGNPEHVASSHEEDSVGGFLVAGGFATGKQVAQAEAEKARFGGELVPALFGLGILNAGSAFAQLAQHAVGVLMKALFAESGRFTFEHKELPPQKAMPLGNRWAVLSEAMRKLPGPELRRRLQKAADFPVMKSGGRVELQELRLTPQETRALGYVDGVRSLNQLAADLPQDADNLFRLALLLQELDMVSFAAVTLPQRQPPPAAAPPPAAPTPPPNAAKPAPAPAAAKPASPPPAAAKPAPAAAQRPPPPKVSPAPPASAPRPAAAPAAPPDFAAELKELQARAAALKEQNLFQVLGVPENVDAGAVKVAYFKLAKSFHPDTVPPDAPPELGKLKADVFAAVGEAYRRLSDDKSRADYLAELKAGGSGEQIDVQQILMAEELFQRGSIMVKAKKFADAVKMLDDAIKANAEEGEFYAWRAIARFFAAADRKVGYAEASKDIAAALKKNPRCAQAFFFQGQMSKLLGDNSAAVKAFQRTVELQPAHVDAQRELRMIKK